MNSKLNPYESPTPPAVIFKQSRFGRAKNALHMYLWHHSAAVLAFIFVALIFDSERQRIFPSDDPISCVVMLTVGVPMYDCVLLMEPLLDFLPPGQMSFRLMRSVATASIIIACLMNINRPRSWVTTYIVLMTFACSCFAMWPSIGYGG